MNLNKISCQKYVWLNSLFEFIPYLGVVSQILSQICHENINKPLDGAYLADFGIDISPTPRKNSHTYILTNTTCTYGYNTN